MTKECNDVMFHIYKQCNLMSYTKQDHQANASYCHIKLLLCVRKVYGKSNTQCFLNCKKTKASYEHDVTIQARNMLGWHLCARHVMSLSS